MARATATVIVALAAVGAPFRAVADDAEGSFHLELSPRLARTEDARERDDFATLPGLALGVRGSYGLTDHLAAEVTIGGSFGFGTTLHDQRTDTGVLADLRQNEHAAFATAGLTARLGVRFVPTLTLQAGYQHRFLPDADFIDPATGFDLQMPVLAHGRDDLLVVAGVGFDYRIDKHWIIGVQVRATYALPVGDDEYRAIDLPIHIAYYSYPEMWFR
jgi:outer membrane protein W